MKKIYLLAFSVLRLMSCQSDELATNGMYSDKFMSKLNFKTVRVADLAETRAGNGDDQQDPDDEKEDEPEDVSIGIFSVRFARPSLKCMSGFGFCNFRWFPEISDWIKELKEDLEKYEDSFEIKCDSVGNKYVDVELDEEREIDADKMQPLIVEEELESSAGDGEEEMIIIVPKGEYKFNPLIGKRGGYRVPLK